MGKYKVIDGNEACAHISYMFTEIAGIYPITPASPMSEYIDKWSTEGRLNLFNNKVIKFESSEVIWNDAKYVWVNRNAKRSRGNSACTWFSSNRFTC